MIAEQRCALVLSHLRTGLRRVSFGALVATLALFCTVGPHPCQAGPLPDIFSYRAQNLAELRRGFSQPPIEARPWVIWFWWNGVLEREEITRQLRELAAAGFGGAEIRCVTFHGWGGEPLEHMDADSLARIAHKQVDYLSDEFIDLLEHTCKTAKSLDLRLSINMGQGWPPGGPWITDEHRTKLLSWSSHEVEGPSEFVEEQLPAEGFALAWKIIDGSGERTVNESSFVDLAGELKTARGESTLRWKVPEGKWLVGIFRVTPGGIADKGDGPEVDPASRVAVLYHLNYFFGRIDPKLRPFYGETLVEIASDSWEYLHDDKRYWSPAIVESFPKLAGYDLRKKIYALLGYGPNQKRVLRDLESVEQSLVHENFFSKVRQFLHARGLRHRPQAYGRGLSRDYLHAYALSDIPEVEAGVLLPEAPWAAHAVGNPLVTAEAFTFLSTKHEPIGVTGGLDETTPALLRWHANHYYAQGINRLNMHSYSYSPRELPLPGWKMYAEIHLNRTVPWWPAMPSVTTWMARNQWCLQAGTPVAEVLVYPIASNPADEPYNTRTDQPISAANGVVGLNEATLSLFADTMARGVGHQAADLCILDDVKTAEEATTLLDLASDSARLTYCGPSPDEWTALSGPSAMEFRRRINKLQTKGRLIDGRAQGWQSVVDTARRVRWPCTANLVYQHRRVSDADLYFVVNSGDPFTGEISFPHSDQRVEIWNADTGDIRLAAEAAVRDGHTHIKCTLGHFESTLISFNAGGAEVEPVRVVESHSGAFTIDGDGRLVGHFDQPGEHRIALSNGSEVTETIELPQPLPVTGIWQLHVPTDLAVSHPISNTPELKQLVTWRDVPELKNFAGTVAYSTQFNLPSDRLQPDLEWQLDLGHVFEVARVWVNGIEAGVAWSPPFQLPITPLLRPGQNTLRIEVANLLKSHLDRSPTYARHSGLLGPVTLVPARQRVMWPPRIAP